VGRAGVLDPEISSRSWKKPKFGFDKPAPERFALMLWNLCAI